MSVYGTVLGRGDVQRAVLSTLRTWVLYYLAEIERQESITPRTIPPPGQVAPSSGGSYQPDEGSFRGGLDFETWQDDLLPLLIVLAQPSGDAERLDQGVYYQPFEVQVGVVVEADDELSVQRLADRYGKALDLLLTEQGGLGTRVDAVESTIPFAEKTVLTSAHKTELLEGAPRSFARSVTTIHSIVPVLDEAQGPRVPPQDPYADPAGPPSVTEIGISLQSESPLGAFSPATGVSVTNQNVVVSE